MSIVSANRIPPRRLDASIARGQEHLLGMQHPDGHWAGGNHMGVQDTARYLIVKKYLGVLTPQEAKDGADFILSQQRPDGAWSPFPTAHQADVDASALAYAGLHAAGLRDTHAAMQSAKDKVDALGGFAKATFESKLFISAEGVLPAEKSPRMPLAYSLVPGLGRLMIKQMGPWMNIGINVAPPFMNAVHNSNKPLSPWVHPLRTLENKRIQKWLTSHQNPDGDYFGVALLTLMGAASLHSVGVPVSDPRIQNAIHYVDNLNLPAAHGKEAAPYSSEVWDTALSMFMLSQTGMSANDPHMLAGARYLISQQGHEDIPKAWQNPAHDGARSGGWAFEAGNDMGTDTDTTALVLRALGTLKSGGAQVAGLDEALKAGWAYENPMQNKDGGWAAWTHGQRSKKPGIMKADPMTKLVHMPMITRDPATEGLTARVLAALSTRGASMKDPEVQKAVAFLKEQQEPDGSWWERWGINFLMGTAFVLTGLKDVGEDMQQPYVQKAAQWMMAKQNADGGWGETPDSFQNPSVAGDGPSAPTLTGLVVSGLIDAGQGDSPAVRKGVEYLIAHQRTDGGWDDAAPQGVGEIWQKMFYYNDLFPQSMTLGALGHYREFLNEAK